MNVFNKIKQLFNRGMYVILDPEDNSVTLSRKLYKHIERNPREHKVFVFKVGDEYGFTLNIPQEPTQISIIQYNSKYKSIGFETLCPTVNRIFYDYGLPLGKCKLTVKVNKKLDFYKICKP